ncbi:AraC family transcriptional regulator [Aliikangiella marina]|uniref:AraC family transcriptional regulator n=1 Tax=Aliikangiella marina TaxID=1712262 RepID=A0A545T7D4_9GAMM|nr:AraC family transcriptional regulator [Aliikangiella marina]TQV73140.1 AraC family transcriptional regulator [Aliikangiella marina]
MPLEGKKHSILSLLPLLKVAEKFGLQPEILLAETGLNIDAMNGAAVIEQSFELEIIGQVLKAANDPLLGLKVGADLSFTSYATYAILLMTAPSLIQSIKAAGEFQSLSLLFSHLSIHREAQWVELRFTLPDVDERYKTFIADRDLIGSFAFMREFLDNKNLSQIKVGTARPKPHRKNFHQYTELLPILPKWNQPYNWFRIPNSMLRLEQKHGNLLAHKLYRLQAQELMRKFYPQADDRVAQVKQLLEGYDNGFPTVPEVAKMFGVSERTFRRQLSDSGTSYRLLLDSQKKARALDMLSRKTVTVAEMAESLDFAESASFLRAFKRWTGTTPKQYLISTQIS